MNRAFASALAAALMVGAASVVVAQNYSLPPSFGTLNLNANFQPDPIVVNVTAGGSIAAERLGGQNCTGTIAQAPDVRVNYQAADLPLFFSVRSSEDTTLVINLPDGRWICNDDFDGLNPGIVLRRPQSGQYDIWVGHFQRGSQVPAQLLISEIPPR